ncbi:MAG TPA: amidophosphoribosyltransferase [Clostridiales bacterium]|nr:amidophosphoribosyltransferase [Clostridiales bacterium]
MSEIKEACGVIGIYNNDGLNLAKELYYGLFALQHRGQESCGMAVSKDNTVKSHRDMGLVSEVFDDAKIMELQGDIGIGHCRYSTTGNSEANNAQPLTMSFVNGTLAIAHNGNLVNAEEIRQQLMEEQGAIFHTTIDSEIFAYLIAKKESETHLLEAAIRKATDLVAGSYALLVMSPSKLVGIRDPLGIKPLCIGIKDNSYILASETCAIESIGGKILRDVEPGEIVVIDKNGLTSHKREKQPSCCHPCIFEYIYFARPDSIMDGQSIYESRHLAGRILAQRYPVDGDVVVAVPDSGIDAAIGYSEESGIPYGIGLIKNRYIARTFIQPGQTNREEAVRIKLNVLENAVKDKKVILIDDSMVRGTVSRGIIKMMKRAGAKEVHMRISAPPFTWPCFYGIDLPEKKQLTAYNRTIEDIRQQLQADSLGFFYVEDLPKIIPNCKLKGHCDACFTGNYPVPVTLKEEDQ